MTIIQEKKTIKEIPVIICKRDDNFKKPLVFMSHGFTGSKDDIKNKGYLNHLAELGYYAVAIDNRLHGDRPGPNLRTTIIKTDGKVDLFLLRKAINETADDVKLLIDELSIIDDVDENKIAMIGISMGGFITYRSIIIDDRIKVGIPNISSPFWDDIPGDIPIHLDKNNKDELAALSECYQPSNNLNKYYPTSLLMQIGDIDKHYNVNNVKDFYYELKKYYTDSPERLELIVYPNMGHEFTQEMWEQALRFLKKNL